MNRQFEQVLPNRVWVCDITYIRTKSVAAVLEGADEPAAIGVTLVKLMTLAPPVKLPVAGTVTPSVFCTKLT